MNTFSDYIVYVDESGDHGLVGYSAEFPVFVLTFCIFQKQEYIHRIVPALQELKFKHFGHDMVVLHERDIRKASGSFGFLTNAERRVAFMADLNTWIDQSTFSIVAIVIRKSDYAARHSEASNPYHFAMRLGLERVEKHLSRRGQHEFITHFVFESRGKRENNELELEFRRVCDGQYYRGKAFPFEIIIAGKQINSCGLQLADLTARPIGLHVLKPDQPNRAFELIRTKLDRSPTGKIEGYGLKCYP